MNREYKGKNAFPYFEKIRPEELDVILITQYSIELILMVASTSITVEPYPTSSRTTTSNGRYL